MQLQLRSCMQLQATTKPSDIKANGSQVNFENPRCARQL